ncbi:MAG: methionyl-tRNA formyltransferase [Nitrospiraceae bacterium]|nr:methionyl-tRNA formyltransferase [Nitrospiraceae bacterium]
MRIVFFGTPLFAVSSLNKLIEAGEDVIAVVTQADKKKGRGKILSESPIKETALKKGIRVLQPLGMKDENFFDKLQILKPELIVVVAYGKILPEKILNLPCMGCVNVHASILPKYRGAAPIQWTIINGEKTTGVTTMLIDKGLDTGDILLQKELAITRDDTTESLSIKLSELGASLLLETIDKLKNGSIRPLKQPDEATYAPIIKKEDGLIIWSRKSEELYNFIRGMHPWPGAYCYLRNERIKLIKVESIEGSGTPGRIEKIGKNNLIVGTGSGLISIVELQPEGKGMMPAGAFIQGRDIKEGMYFDEK